MVIPMTGLLDGSSDMFLGHVSTLRPENVLLGPLIRHALTATLIGDGIAEHSQWSRD